MKTSAYDGKSPSWEKKTYAEYALQHDPQLAEKADYFARLGVRNPVLWAEAEVRGEPAVASCLLAYALRSEIANPDNHAWSDAIKSGTINVENQPLLTAAAQALQYAEDHGVDLRRLTPLVRVIQSQCVRNFATLLDEGPQLLGLPIPSGYEATWQLYEDRDDGGAKGKPISGLHELIDDPDPV